jgi:hypothetical protein
MNRNDQLENFARLLRARGRKRIVLSELRACFGEAFPEYRQAGDFEKLLLQNLDLLAGERVLRLPAARTRKHFEQCGPLRLPRWVMRLDPPPVRPAKASEGYHWLPELAELAPRLRRPQQSDLLKINEFLIANRFLPHRVPVRERLLQIFGDEKRLSVRKGGLFGGKLACGVIGAYDPPLPFCAAGPVEAAPGRPLLVLENHHSFASFVAANDRFRWYSAVAYGAGHAFSKSARGLDDVRERFQADRLLYLGDIDGRGLATPFCIASTRAQLGLMPLEPARPLYAWLLEHGIRRPLPGKITSHAKTSVGTWIGGRDGERIAELWRNRQRIPQESLGLDQLMSGVLEMVD